MLVHAAARAVGAGFRLRAEPVRVRVDGWKPTNVGCGCCLRLLLRLDGERLGLVESLHGKTGEGGGGEGGSESVMKRERGREANADERYARYSAAIGPSLPTLSEGISEPRRFALRHPPAIPHAAVQTCHPANS